MASLLSAGFRRLGLIKKVFRAEHLLGIKTYNVLGGALRMDKPNYANCLDHDHRIQKCEESLIKHEKCLFKKVPMRLFLWLIGALAFFTIIIVGGAQWKIVADIAKIRTQVAIHSTEMQAIERHLGWQR